MFPEGGNSTFAPFAGDSALYIVWLFGPVVICLLAIWKCMELFCQCTQNVYLFFYGKPKAKSPGTKGKSSKDIVRPMHYSKTVTTQSDGAPLDPAMFWQPGENDKVEQDERIIQMSPSYIYMSELGECYHASDSCKGLRMATSKVHKRRACLLCSCLLVVPTYSNTHRIDSVTGMPASSSDCGTHRRNCSRGRPRSESVSTQSHRQSSSETTH